MPLALSKLIVEKSVSESTSDENPKFDLLLLHVKTTVLMQGHQQNFCLQREVLISLSQRADDGLPP